MESLMPRYDLEDKVAVVTGGGSGIGCAIALRLGIEGCNIVVADRNETSANQVADEINQAGGTALSHTVDVTQRDKIEQSVERPSLNLVDSIFR